MLTHALPILLPLAAGLLALLFAKQELKKAGL